VDQCSVKWFMSEFIQELYDNDVSMVTKMCQMYHSYWQQNKHIHNLQQKLQNSV